MQFKSFFSRKNILKLKKKTQGKKSNLNDLIDSFNNSINENLKNTRKAAVLFSGGIDSTLIALALKNKLKNLRLITVGFKDSNALSQAKKTAEFLEIKLISHEITLKELKESIPKTRRIINSNDFQQIQIALPEFLALKEARKHKIKTVFVGQGADELFAGYNYFRNYFNKKNPSKINNLIWSKLLNYWDENLKRDLKLAFYFKIKIKAPYLNKEFIETAMSLPLKEKITGKNDLIRKHAIRKIAVKLGLPRKLALTRKKAIQYDTKVSSKLKKLIKNSRSKSN